MTSVSEYRFENKIHENMQKLCEKILGIENVRFAGLISDRGNLYSGGFKKGVIPKESSEKRRSMYMRFALESCLRRDFDESFGEFKFSIIQRDKLSIITMNVCNYLLLIFAEIDCDSQEIVKTVQRILREGEKEYRLLESSHQDYAQN